MSTSTKPKKASTQKSVNFASAEMPVPLLHRPPSEIHVVNPLGDFLLTVAFGLSVVFTLYSLHFRGGVGDLVLFAGLLIFVAVGVQINKETFQFIGRTISSTLLSGAPFHDPLRKSKTLKKWNDQSWQLTIHFTMTLLEVYVLMDEDWYANPTSMWADGNCPSKNFKFSLKFLYVIQLAIWTWTAISHRFIEERRKDYFIMYFHHVFTIVLVSGSWYGGVPYIGVCILYIHDCSDILVDTTKMVNYLKLEGSVGFFISEINYFLCLSAWGYYRLWVFPYYFIHSAVWESHLYCNPGAPWAGKPWQKFFPPHPKAFIFLAPLLFALLSFHIWWFFLLLRIGYRSISAPSMHDVGADEYEGGSGSEKEHID